MAADNAITFGASAQIEAPAGFSWASAYDLGLWVNHSSIGATNRIAFVYDWNGSVGYFDILGLTVAGKLWLYSESPAGNSYVEAVGTVPTATWQYYRLVRTSTTSLELYVDNVLTLSHSLDMTGASSGNAILFVSATGDYIRGSTAYGRMYTAALSGAQSAAERLSPTAIVTANLWADWWLQGSTDLADHSGNARNFTLSGGSLTTTTGPGIAPDHVPFRPLVITSQPIAFMEV